MLEAFFNVRDFSFLFFALPCLRLIVPRAVGPSAILFMIHLLHPHVRTRYEFCIVTKRFDNRFHYLLIYHLAFKSKEAHYLKETDVFLWDEAPMAMIYVLEITDQTLRDIMNNDLLIDEKIIVLGGDFRQLLPIKVHGTRSKTVNISIKFISIWKHFIQFFLTENM